MFTCTFQYRYIEQRCNSSCNRITMAQRTHPISYITPIYWFRRNLSVTFGSTYFSYLLPFTAGFWCNSISAHEKCIAHTHVPAMQYHRQRWHIFVFGNTGNGFRFNWSIYWALYWVHDGIRLIWSTIWRNMSIFG